MSQVGAFPIVPHMASFIARTSIAYLIALVLVGLRIYSRILTKAGLGWDDSFIITSTASALVLLGMEALLCTIGIGYSMAEVGDNKELLIQLLTVSNLVFVITTLTYKLGILCFYLRVFTQGRKLRIAIKFVIGFFIVWALVSIIDLFVVCHPDLGGPDSDSCDRGSVFRDSSALCIFGDMAALALPLPAIWKLQASRRTKIKITVLFHLGVLVTLVAILRMRSIIHTNFKDTEVGIITQDSVGYAGLEPVVGIICACLPMVHNLFVERYNDLVQWAKPRSAWPWRKDQKENAGDEDTSIADEEFGYKWSVTSGGKTVTAGRTLRVPWYFTTAGQVPKK
ncbi:hypothetical protein M426DRAFT_13033 [Hypoxylon sp. CI-4A]|nr:hypothetical protein M426DRAFT_13033 [Hypoxylon sp. CI-4A]